MPILQPIRDGEGAGGGGVQVISLHVSYLTEVRKEKAGDQVGERE